MPILRLPSGSSRVITSRRSINNLGLYRHVGCTGRWGIYKNLIRARLAAVYNPESLFDFGVVGHKPQPFAENAARFCILLSPEMIGTGLGVYHAYPLLGDGICVRYF